MHDQPIASLESKVMLQLMHAAAAAMDRALGS